MKNSNGDMCCSKCGGTELNYYCISDYLQCLDEGCKHGDYIIFHLQLVRKELAGGPLSTE